MPRFSASCLWFVMDISVGVCPCQHIYAGSVVSAAVGNPAYRTTDASLRRAPVVVTNISVPPPRRALGIVKQLRSLREIAKKAGQALLLFLRQALPPTKNVNVPYLSRSLLGNLIGFNAFDHLAPPKAKEVRLCYLSLIKQELTK